MQRVSELAQAAVAISVGRTGSSVTGSAYRVSGNHLAARRTTGFIKKIPIPLHSNHGSALCATNRDDNDPSTHIAVRRREVRGDPKLRAA